MDRKRMIGKAIVAGFLAFAVLPGCSAETQKWLLTTFFDGADSPPPPTRRVRSDLQREIDELKRQLAESQQKLSAGQEGAKAGKGPAGEAAAAVQQAKSWEEAKKILPKDKSGQTDWVQALKAGAIAPRPSPDPKAPDQAVLPLDVELIPAVGEMFKVVFSHKIHTEWLGCPNCHTGIFQMAKGSSAITMEKINAGQYCGVCHGKVAFPATTCGRCHPAMAGGG